MFDIENNYWEAFWNLNGDRREGGAIPWTATRNYFLVDGFGDFNTFQRIIKSMDSEYLRLAREKK